MTDLRETIRDRYAASARAVAAGNAGSCCDRAGASVEIEEGFGAALYAAADRDQLPAGRRGLVRLRQPDRGRRSTAGERVLDLGSGGGIDVLLSVRRVGSEGRRTGWT